MPIGLRYALFICFWFFLARSLKSSGCGVPRRFLSVSKKDFKQVPGISKKSDWLDLSVLLQNLNSSASKCYRVFVVTLRVFLFSYS